MCPMAKRWPAARYRGHARGVDRSSAHLSFGLVPFPSSDANDPEAARRRAREKIDEVTITRISFITMSLSGDELAKLNEIADDLREAFSAYGHTPMVAARAHKAFGQYTISAARRELAADAVSESATRLGVDFRPVHGQGRELQFWGGAIDRRYRLLRAKRRKDGRFVVVVNAESALGEDDDSLYVQDHRVFLYTLDDNGQVEWVVTAPILEKVGDKPKYLNLGELTLLGSRPIVPPDPISFATDHDDELEFPDDDTELGDVASG